MSMYGQMLLAWHLKHAVSVKKPREKLLTINDLNILPLIMILRMEW